MKHFVDIKLNIFQVQNLIITHLFF